MRKGHLNFKNYVCTFCDKRLTSKIKLTTHIRGHEGERTWKCDIFPESCVHKSKLDEHLQKHTNELPFG